MTGPEHFREAERVIRLSDGQELDVASTTLACAQVHATLALTAATAQAGGLVFRDSSGHSEWWTALNGEAES